MFNDFQPLSIVEKLKEWGTDWLQLLTLNYILHSSKQKYFEVFSE